MHLESGSEWIQKKIELCFDCRGLTHVCISIYTFEVQYECRKTVDAMNARHWIEVDFSKTMTSIVERYICIYIQYECRKTVDAMNARYWIELEFSKTMTSIVEIYICMYMALNRSKCKKNNQFSDCRWYSSECLMSILI